MVSTLSFSSPLDSIATLERGIVTLVYGPPAVGKTNVCLCALRSAGNSIYIDTEGGFSPLRAQQLKLDLDKILYKRVSDFHEQQKLLAKLDLGCDLLVVDSLVMLYRLELRDNPDKVNALLAKQLSALSSYADKMNAAVLVTGQVYRDFGTKEVQIAGGDVLKYWPKTIIELSHDGRKKRAALQKHRSLPPAEVSFVISADGLGRPGLLS